MEIAMRAIIFTALIAGTIGFVAGNAFWYLASPLWIDREVSETLVVTETSRSLASGAFTDADRSHRGEGTVTVVDTGIETVVRFTEFKVTNGPDLYVWLVKASDVASSADVKESEWLELGVLKGNIGDQNYSLPADTNLDDYKSVVVWCKQFGVLFAKAQLAAL
jgi:hypothetical protein